MNTEQPAELRTYIIHSPLSLDHDTGATHVESKARYRAVIDVLQQHGLLTEASEVLAPLAHESLIRLCHDEAYISKVRKECSQLGEGVVMPLTTGDTIISRGSYKAARAMVGGAVRAVDLIMGGQARNGFVVARPPGHHAERRKGMGFCVFNTVAIAARYLQSRYGLQRIAIIDWDAHHGNGTEKEFATDSSVLYISTHLQGGYPGTGSQRSPNEHTVNCPIMPGPYAREKLLEFYRKELPLLLRSFRPQFMLISCGFDAHAFDPIASLGLETEDFGELTEIASGEARRWCGGKLLSVLEGGYHIESLAASALLHVQVLRREP